MSLQFFRQSTSERIGRFMARHQLKFEALAIILSVMAILWGIRLLAGE